MNIVAVKLATALSLSFVLAACSSGSGDSTNLSGQGSYTSDGSGSSGSADYTSQPSSPETSFDPVTVSLSWNVPVTRENGDPLSIADLGGYEIYYYREGEDLGSDCCIVTVDDPQATSFELQIAEAGTYFFSISAFDSNNVFSDFSEPVSAVF